jgi:UDPglucose--hexose-1-phosphate uridylyltransferase
MMAKDPCAAYVAPFCNWGPTAGASVWHPHYQILSLPIVPSHIAHSLRDEAAYFKKNRRCVRCDLIRFERKEKMRIIEENAHAIAIAPYASKVPLEVNILTKQHFPSFRETPLPVVRGMALLLRSTLRRIRTYANDPDFNFLIHDAPTGPKKYDFHHWHIEVIPKISTPAGFETSTGVFINTVEPEKAARILRGKKA